MVNMLHKILQQKYIDINKHVDDIYNVLTYENVNEKTLLGETSVVLAVRNLNINDKIYKKCLIKIIKLSDTIDTIDDKYHPISIINNKFSPMYTSNEIINLLIEKSQSYNVLLNYFVKTNHLPLINTILIDKLIYLHKFNQHKPSPLQTSVMNYYINPAVIKYILLHSSLNEIHHSFNNENPLTISLQHQKSDIITEIIDAYKDFDGDVSPIMNAVYNNCKPSILFKLLDKSDNIQGVTSNGLDCAMTLLLMYQNIPEIYYFLDKIIKNINIYHKDRRNRTLFNYMCDYGDVTNDTFRNVFIKYISMISHQQLDTQPKEYLDIYRNIMFNKRKVLIQFRKCMRNKTKR